MRRVLPFLALCAFLVAPASGQGWPDKPDPNEKIDSGKYWGWVEECARRGEPKGLELLTEITKQYVGENYHTMIYNAIKQKLLEAEDAVKRDEDGAKEKLAKYTTEVEMLAKAIKNVTGDATEAEWIEMYKKMSPEARKETAQADERIEQAKKVMEHEKDFNSGMARAEAGLNLYRKYGDKARIAKALIVIAECHEHLKNGPLAFAALEEALKLLRECGTEPELLKETEAKVAALKAAAEAGVGLSIEKSALDKDESWEVDKEGKPKWESFPMTPGTKQPKLPARIPNTMARNHYFFWKQIYLEDGRKGVVGGVPGAEKIPLPGDHWFVKTPGEHEIVLTPDPSKPLLGAKFKVGFAPSLEELKVQYPNPNPKPGAPASITIPYYYEVMALKEIQMYGLKVGVANPPNILDLRAHGLAWRTGKGPGNVPFTIIDGNFNGVFGIKWSVTPGLEADCDLGNDGFVAGGSKVGTVFSPLVRMGKGYYICDPAKHSFECAFRKYKGTTGKLQVKLNGFKPGVKPVWLIVESGFTFKREKKEESVRVQIDVSDAARGPIDIPDGGWKLVYGLVSDGDDEDTANRADIQPGTFPKFRVKPGETTVIELGGPFTPDVAVEWDQGKNEATLKTMSLLIHGAKGEIYHSLWPEAWEYDFDIKDSRGVTMDSGSARKLGERDEKNPHAAMGFPKQAVIRGKSGFVPPFWAAIRGQHKLFGAIARTKAPAPPEPPPAAPPSDPADGGKPPANGGDGHGKK